MTAKQQSEIDEWKDAEERHAQERITKRNGMDQRMTKVRGEAFRHSSSFGGSCCAGTIFMFRAWRRTRARRKRCSSCWSGRS
jgi:hypothetical protein